QGVVAGITRRFLSRHRSVVGPKRPTRAVNCLTILRHEHAVFGERTARSTARGNLVGLAHTEAEGCIAWVRLTNDQDVVTPAAGVARADDGVARSFPLNRKHVVF